MNRFEPRPDAKVSYHILEDDGAFPNNGRLPLIAYLGAFALPEQDPATAIEAAFSANRWGNSWRNGVYGFHHYHSIAHEVLGVYRGAAKIQFGGPQGIVLPVGRGDVVVIPAGVAHKNLGASQDFALVGAYPVGQRPDMMVGRPGERPGADENIARVALPEADPVFGREGRLQAHWRARDSGSS